MKQNDQGGQPFFAQFLVSEKVADTQQHLGTKPYLDGDQTMKYPSDNDDNPPDTFAAE